MKAKNSNSELNYNLNEGKHKKTLLEKYLNQWTGEERINATVNLRSTDFVAELVEETESQFSSSVVTEYKEFLNRFDKFNTEKDLNNLGELIDSKDSTKLSEENITNLIKNKFK